MPKTKKTSKRKPNPAFTETRIDLELGDAFLLYTDGLFSWSKDERHRLTPQQLENLLNRSAPSAEALLKGILAQTAPENPAKSAPDDLAALAVRRVAKE